MKNNKKGQVDPTIVKEVRGGRLIAYLNERTEYDELEKTQKKKN